MELNNQFTWDFGLGYIHAEFQSNQFINKLSVLICKVKWLRLNNELVWVWAIFILNFSINYTRNKFQLNWFINTVFMRILSFQIAAMFKKRVEELDQWTGMRLWCRLQKWEIWTRSIHNRAVGRWLWSYPPFFFLNNYTEFFNKNFHLKQYN